MSDLRQRIIKLEKCFLDEGKGAEFYAAEARRGLAHYKEFGQVPDDLNPRIAQKVLLIFDAVLANNVVIWEV